MVAIEPCEFVGAVEPLLERKDHEGLLALLKSRWTYEQLQGLLNSRHTDARKVALLAVGMVGKSCCVPELARQLRDPDPVVNEMAEHAMWMIWFRAGTEEANHQIGRGAQALGRRDFEHAISHFNKALELSPTFAEAYNQRAIAHYLSERFEESIADCRRAIELMPCHFGALAGMGHAYAHLGRAHEAIVAYEQALAVNPHLTCVQQAIDELKGRLEEQQ